VRSGRARAVCDGPVKVGGGVVTEALAGSARGIRVGGGPMRATGPVLRSAVNSRRVSAGAGTSSAARAPADYRASDNVVLCRSGYRRPTPHTHPTARFPPRLHGLFFVQPFRRAVRGCVCGVGCRDSQAGHNSALSDVRMWGRARVDDGARRGRRQSHSIPRHPLSFFRPFVCLVGACFLGSRRSAVIWFHPGCDGGSGTARVSGSGLWSRVV
jgi:hypothetical protein